MILMLGVGESFVSFVRGQEGAGGGFVSLWLCVYFG